MDDRARPGRWILLAVTAITVLSEGLLALVALLSGRLEAAQVVRIVLTVGILWQVWEGARWARWLTVALSLAGAVFVVVIGLVIADGEARPKVRELSVAVAAFCTAIAVAMASPWVGAYQAAQRRNKSDTRRWIEDGRRD